MKVNPRVRRRQVRKEMTKLKYDVRSGEYIHAYESRQMKLDLSHLSTMVDAANRVVRIADNLTYINWSREDYDKFEQAKKLAWKAHAALLKAWEKYDAEAARAYRKKMGKRKED